MKTSWWLISHWANSKQPFLANNILWCFESNYFTSYSIFQINDIFDWVSTVELKNVVLLAKQDKIWKYLQKYNLVLARVDKAPEYLRWDDGRSFAQILNSLKFSWKEVHVIFFEVWFLKHFSDIPKHAIKSFNYQCYGIIRIFNYGHQKYQLNI